MRQFNHHPEDIISDPGGEEAMDADFGGASYRFGDVTRAVTRGDISGARQAGRLLRDRLFGNNMSSDPATADKYPEERMDDEGPVTIRPEDIE